MTHPLYVFCCFYVFWFYHIISYSLGSFFYKYMILFLFNTAIYVFLLEEAMYYYCCLCILIVSLRILIVVYVFILLSMYS
jgi:hypothetical protein